MSATHHTLQVVSFLLATMALCVEPASAQTAPCLSVADAEDCGILKVEFEGPDQIDGNNIVVVHYNAGVTQVTADNSNVAYVEVLNAQFASSQTLTDPENYALNVVMTAPTSDGSNLPPALLTLDAALGGLGEPAFGGLPAVWTVDFYSGPNTPGDLVGIRTHTVMYGTPADGLCEQTQTFSTPTDVFTQTVYGIEGGIYHSVVQPEVDLTTATLWDGAAFTVPVPGLGTVEPFLYGETHTNDSGFVMTPSLLSGSAEPTLIDFASIWTTDNCARDTLESVATNRLGLDVVDEQSCYGTDDLIEVELNMNCLEGDVTGFFASVSYDPSFFALQTVLSSYTSTPFPLHISVPIVDAGGGTILLDGSVGFTDPGSDDDALLATLVFKVLAGNDGSQTEVAFTAGGGFPTEFSYLGLPLPTRLGNPLSWTMDDIPPAFVCPADISVFNDPGLCSAAVVITPPLASDDCGLASVVGVRSDALPLDDPYPAGCAPGFATTITWTATDCAGGTTACTQTVTVTDNEAPVLSGVPADITVTPLAGSCEAEVTFTAPTATDNCDATPLVVLVRSDNLLLSDPYPEGITTVTATATDSCLNFSAATFDITVEEFNDVDIEVVLVGVFTDVSRCITFMTSDCSETSEVLFFSDLDLNPATPVQAMTTVEIPCGTYSSLCVKDRQHTQWTTTTLSGLGSSGYVADSVVTLDGGDTDDDGDVDINDVTWYLFQFGSLAASGGCPWDGLTRDADFSNNGAVGSEDYPFLTANFLSMSSCSCVPPLPDTAGRGQGAGSSARWSLPLSQLPSPMHDRVDLNRDQVVNHLDVRLFESQHGLPHQLSERMRQAEGR